MSRKTDANQAEIMRDLRKVGRSVQDLHVLGKGCPDLLVGYRGQNYLLEVKQAGCGLTEDELAWHELWRGQVSVVFTSEGAIKATGG
jgi:hypothetical protein